MRLDLLHLKVRLRLFMHDRRDNDTEDDRDNDNCQTPVTAEVVEELDNVKYPVLENIPHVLLSLHQPRVVFTEQDRIRKDRQGDTSLNA